MSATLPLAAPGAAAAPSIPWLGLTAVLMGTFISTLNGRLSNFGLADIRGAVGAGFDDGAWITTAQTVAQMCIALVAVYLGSVHGPRRVLMAASSSFAAISLLTPFCGTLPVLLGMQFLAGLASGFFVPLTLSYVLRNTPPRYWVFGIALYALNLELSLNISASLEGWYVEHLSWRWIFWQNVPLALIMTLCLRFGVAVQVPDVARPPPDYFGMASSGLGLALVYAALDQGNRLDWLNSGLICGLLLAGALLLICFLVHEVRTPHPLLNLRIAFSKEIQGLLLLVAFLRLTILGTAYLIPLFLGSVRGFRALEVGETLFWIAVPQLVLCPLAALMLRRSDARLVAALGFVLISVAFLLVAYQITPIWGSDQFLPSQLMQAMGQSFALSGVLFFAILHLKPEQALTFGAALQTARLMGGEIGTAFVVTLARVRTQVASNHIGLHLQNGDADVLQRVRAYGGAGRGLAVLGSVVRRAAVMQAVMDCFVVLGLMTAVILVLLVLYKPAPKGPASAMPLFRQRGEPIV